MSSEWERNGEITNINYLINHQINHLTSWIINHTNEQKHWLKQTIMASLDFRKKIQRVVRNLQIFLYVCTFIYNRLCTWRQLQDDKKRKSDARQNQNKISIWVFVELKIKIKQILFNNCCKMPSKQTTLFSLNFNQTQEQKKLYIIYLYIKKFLKLQWAK